MNVMKRLLGIALAIAFSTTVASAANLNVTLRTPDVPGVPGTSTLTGVLPGAIVDYEVVGELTDALNQGLALWSCDIAFSGGPLLPGQPGPGMGDFVRDFGITNPAGYGGTTTVAGREGELVQPGGGMNTILNFSENAQFPIGVVTEFIAQPGSPEVLMTGSLTAPDAEGTYLLTASNCFGNVIKDGETGDPFWATEPFGVGTVTNLSITVVNPLANLNFLALAATEYPCDATLSRNGNNILRFEFSIPVTAPLPSEIEINELLGPGMYGPDISALFTITVEGGNVLKITEVGNVFANETWYAIRNVGSWVEAANFEVDYAVVFGDADGLGGTAFGDLAAIFNVLQTGPPPNNLPDSSRFDIDGLGGVAFADLSVAFNFINSTPGPKPTPAGCTP